MPVRAAVASGPGAVPVAAASAGRVAWGPVASAAARAAVARVAEERGPVWESASGWVWAAAVVSGWV